MSGFSEISSKNYLLIGKLWLVETIIVIATLILTILAYLDIIDIGIEIATYDLLIFGAMIALAFGMFYASMQEKEMVVVGAALICLVIVPIISVGGIYAIYGTSPDLFGLAYMALVLISLAIIPILLTVASLISEERLTTTILFLISVLSLLGMMVFYYSTGAVIPEGTSEAVYAIIGLNWIIATAVSVISMRDKVIEQGTKLFYACLLGFVVCLITGIFFYESGLYPVMILLLSAAGLGLVCLIGTGRRIFR